MADEKANRCEECGIDFKSPQARGAHNRNKHPRTQGSWGKKKNKTPKAPKEPKSPTSRKPILKVPEYLEGTALGESIAIMLESRKANQDEVDRIDKTIRELLEGRSS